MAEPYECPPSHKHAATTTCNKNHGCRCDPCCAAEIARHTANQRKRRRAKLYGRYTPRVPATGTHRRIQALQYLGWTFGHIGAVSGVSYGAVANLMRRTTVEPATRDNIAEAYRQLVAKGQGPSAVTRRRALANGYVSPLSWDDIDSDAEPIATEHQRILAGEELTNEIEWLVQGGVSAHDISRTLGKTLEALEHHAWRWGRNDLASALREKVVA